MSTSVTGKIFALLCVFLLDGALPSIQAEKHSLYYIYTALSKPLNLPGIYEFSAMGLLDDRQIHSYNSEEQKKIPKQHWMKEKMPEDYWEEGTQSRKITEQTFNENIDILMKPMRRNESDLHVLQMAAGCVGEQQGNEVRFSGGFMQYGYDGEDFLSFDIKSSLWIASVYAAVPTMRKWNDELILNMYIKRYLEKVCVDWLKKFREYADEELRNVSHPDVHVFAKMYIMDKKKLKLTCLATGFYPRDVMMTIRINHTSVSEYEVESTGIRPNHDGTFQLMKSVKINEDEEADCFVSHRTSKEPIIIRWDGKCQNCPPDVVAGFVGAVTGGVLLVIVLYLVVYILKKRKITVDYPTHTLTFQMEETPTGRDTAGASDVSTTNYWDDVNQEYEDTRSRLAAESTEALIQQDEP